MTSRFAITLVGGLVLGAAAVVGCSGSKSHPGAAPECAPGRDCIGVGSPSGPVVIISSDATSEGGDAETGGEVGDATADAPEAGTAVSVPTGLVNTATIVTVDPATAPLDTADGNLFVISSTGGIAQSNPVAAGHFTVTNDDVYSGFALLQLVDKDTTTGTLTKRTLYELPYTTPTLTSPLAVPLFASNAPATWAASLGLTALTTASRATIVYQLVDGSGAGVSGIAATPTTGPLPPCTSSSTDGPCGPYYDDADALSGTAAFTGPRGTIVFLALPGGGASFLAFSISLNGAVTSTISNMSTANDAITFVRLQVK